MKKLLLIPFFVFAMIQVEAQCSICTKTASQLGEKPAKGLNTGIVYLMVAPFALIGIIGYKWWKREQKLNK
ncbi:MAG: hypothetical protein K0Q66_1050 [Chitinophagaceae bacterium]|jgi:hypothetical protein|nr:hypothetical protein [Chitinophagaceae bacterium]